MIRRIIVTAMLALALLATSCGQPDRPVPTPTTAQSTSTTADDAAAVRAAAPVASPPTVEPTAARTRTAATPFPPPPTPPPLPAGVYLMDGFEGDQLEGWRTTGTGQAIVQRKVAQNGQGAVALTTTDKQYVAISKTLQGGAQALAYSRFCIRLAGLSGSTVLAQGLDNARATLWEIDYDEPRRALDVYFWNGRRTRFDVYTPENSIDINAWTCIEIQTGETSEGTGAVWINGKPSGAVSADFSVTQAYSQLFLWNGAPTGTIYFDDVKVADTDSGLGTPGTPAPAAAPAAEPRGPIPAGWQVYAGTSLPFALAYPPDWTVDESHMADGVVYFRSVAQPTTWVMIATRVKAEGRTADELRDEYYREQFADCVRRGIEETRDDNLAGLIFKELGTTCDLADGLYYSYIGLGLKEGVPWRYRLNARYAQYRDNAPTFTTILGTLNIYANPPAP